MPQKVTLGNQYEYLICSYISDSSILQIEQNIETILGLIGNFADTKHFF